MKTTQSLAVTAALFFLAACGHEEPPKTAYRESPASANAAPEPSPGASGELPSQSPQTPPPLPHSTPVAGPTSAGVPHEGPTAGNPESQPANNLSDGEILEVVHAANAAEIEQAKLALRRSKNPRVRKYAEMMVRDHTQADAKGAVTAKKANVKRNASATSEELTGTADGTTRTLDAEPPQDFDKEYVDSQIHEHQTVLDTIDQKLLDSAQDANVRAYLIDVRAAVASHLQHAQDLQKGMQR